MIRRRAVGVIAALVLAAIGTIILVAYVRGADERASRDEELVEVLVVQQEIERGTPVSDFGSRVALEDVPARLRANGALTSLEGVSGRVAAVTLLPGEQVVSSRLVTPSAAAAENVPPDLHLVTVALDATRVVGGQVRPGDRVAVISSFSTDPPLTHIILHKVLVAGVRTGDDGARVTAPVSGPSPVGTLHVTLALAAPAVERVVFSAEHGTIWLSLEPADAPEGGTKIVTPGNIYQ